MKSAIDHLVVTADTRPAGATYLAEILGVEPLEGGEHPRMGTHNALVRLGASAYVEALAVNPAAPKPARPRWFGLAHLREGTRPHLAAWVVRTTDIEHALAVSRLPLGSIETMRRDSFEGPVNLAVPLAGQGAGLLATIQTPRGICELGV